MAGIQPRGPGRGRYRSSSSRVPHTGRYRALTCTTLNLLHVSLPLHYRSHKKLTLLLNNGQVNGKVLNSKKLGMGFALWIPSAEYIRDAFLEDMKEQVPHIKGYVTMLSWSLSHACFDWCTEPFLNASYRHMHCC